MNGSGKKYHFKKIQCKPGNEERQESVASNIGLNRSRSTAEKNLEEMPKITQEESQQNVRNTAVSCKKYHFKKIECKPGNEKAKWQESVASNIGLNTAEKNLEEMPKITQKESQQNVQNKDDQPLQKYCDLTPKSKCIKSSFSWKKK